MTGTPSAAAPAEKRPRDREAEEAAPEKKKRRKQHKARIRVTVSEGARPDDADKAPPTKSALRRRRKRRQQKKQQQEEKRQQKSGQEAGEEAADGEEAGGEGAEAAAGEVDGEEAAPKVDSRLGPQRTAALEYLNLWLEDRDGWKFSKKRQTFLLQNWAERAVVPKADFKALLQYVEPLKGAARVETVRQARELVDQAEAATEEPDEAFLRRLKRARKMLKALA